MKGTKRCCSKKCCCCWGCRDGSNNTRSLHCTLGTWADFGLMGIKPVGSAGLYRREPSLVYQQSCCAVGCPGHASVTPCQRHPHAFVPHSWRPSRVRPKQPLSSLLWLQHPSPVGGGACSACFQHAPAPALPGCGCLSKGARLGPPRWRCCCAAFDHLGRPVAATRCA